jgi:invasion protein IalB
MIRQAVLAVAISMTSMLLSGSLAAGQEAIPSGYRVKPSDVAVPADAKLGEYQRTTRPFENWTLICDENLQARQKVCNVTQIIEDQAGQVAFSWSLAATKEGNPYMILRAPPIARSDAPVSLTFEGRKEPIKIQLDGCNQAVCVGMLPVGPIMREQISKAAASVISFPTTDGRTINVTATLKGLAAAVEAIN